MKRTPGLNHGKAMTIPVSQECLLHATKCHTDATRYLYSLICKCKCDVIDDALHDHNLSTKKNSDKWQQFAIINYNRFCPDAYRCHLSWWIADVFDVVNMSYTHLLRLISWISKPLLCRHNSTMAQCETGIWFIGIATLLLSRDTDCRLPCWTVCLISKIVLQIFNS